MSIQLPVINTAADTFQNWIDKTNAVVNTVANSVITANTNANGATTTGNAFITGTFGATVIVVGTSLRGGNVQTANVLTISSNLALTANLLTLGANVTVNTSSMTIGANLLLTDTKMSFGNSTINAVVNSVGISISGALMPYANNKTSVAIDGVLIGNATRVNFSGAGSSNLVATVDSGNSQINVIITSSLALGSAGGVNTNILFNDIGQIGGNGAFTFNKTTNNVFLANTLTIGTTVVNSSVFFAGNSTVNTTANSTLDSFSNATVTSSFGLGGIALGANVTANLSQINVGTTAVNSSVVQVGANVIMSGSQISIGNTTVNVVANSTTIQIGGGLTATASLLSWSNVQLNSSALAIGNVASGNYALSQYNIFQISGGGVTAFLQPTFMQIGANLAITTSNFTLGNNTVQWSGNSSTIQVSNGVIATIANSNGLAVGGNVAVIYDRVIVGGTTITSTFSNNVLQLGTPMSLNSTQRLQGLSTLSIPPQCGRLYYSVPGNLAFVPFNGDLIRINGILYRIPAGGITGLATVGVFVEGVAGQNLAAGTNYYVYVFNNGGTLTAEFSGQPYTTSGTPGNEGTIIKTGQDSRTLIGRVWLNGSGAFTDSTTLSWFNKRPKSAFESTASTGDGLQCGVIFVGWSNEAVQLSFMRTAICDTPRTIHTAVHNIDGVDISIGVSHDQGETVDRVALSGAMAYVLPNDFAHGYYVNVSHNAGTIEFAQIQTSVLFYG